MSFFIYWHSSWLFAEDIIALAGVTLGKQGEHLYFMSHEFINWNDNFIEKSIHRKQETLEIVRWAQENTTLHSHRLNWKKPLGNRFQFYLREDTYLHIQFSVFLILHVPINQIINMDNHQQK